MWQENSTIAKEIGRTNRNLLVVNVGLLAIVLFSFVCGFRLLFNEVAGPIELDAKSLLAMKEPHKDFRYNFKVTGGKITRDPIFEEDYVRYDRNNEEKSREVEALYYLMFVPSADTGFKALVVASGAPIKTKTVQGALVLIPNKLKSQLVANLPPGMMSSIMLPTMLDTQRFNGGSFWACGIYLPLLLLAGWNIMKVKQRKENIAEHPIAKQLVPYGNPRDVAASIEDEIRQSLVLRTKSNLVVTPHWLILPTVWSAIVVRTDDIVWMYRKETHHSINFIPSGKSHAVVFNFADKRYVEGALDSEQQVNEVLTTVAQQAPWIILGYSDQLLAHWNKNKDKVIAEVRRARDETVNNPSS